MLDIDNPTSKQLKELISNISDESLKKSINMNLITTMKQARYTKELDGHFGLASQYYCHFTSPIRRYPDLFIHRLVKKYIRKKLNNDVTRDLYDKLSEKVSKHCCYTERNADRAEEELNKIQAMQYMADNPEREYSAIIYGINKSGLLVLVNDVVSGFIRAKNNEDDGEVSSIVINDITYKIGDKINVSFKEYDVKNSKLIFEPLEV
jgi:ribonuclease R